MTITTQPDAPVLDLLDGGFRVDSEEVDRARDIRWWAESAIGPVVLRYDDVVALARDRRLGSGLGQSLDIQGIGPGPLREWWQDMILCQHGARHDRLRRLVVPAFRVPTVDALRPRMREHMAGILDALFDAASGVTCDAVAAIADPYPLAVLADLLDIPASDRPLVRLWANDIGLAFSFQVAEHLERIETAILALYEIADRLIRDRRRVPSEDLIGQLVAAEADGERLDDRELRNLVVTVLFAGHDTTKHQLAGTLHALAARPDLWEQLASRPDLVPNAVEETLRAAPATPLISRVALEDMRYRDLHLHAGDRIMLLIGSANRDRAVFTAPDIDLGRHDARPLTFGGGAHHCIGHLLARAELAEALHVLTATITDVEPAGPVAWRPPTGICGPAVLPLSFRRRLPAPAA